MTDDIFLDTLNKVIEKEANLKKLSQHKKDIKHRNKIRRKARKAKKRELNALNRQKYGNKSGPVKVVYSTYNTKIDFYRTEAWMALRYKVLEKYGAACQCCGATRKDGLKMHVDHIKPRSKYPELELDEKNLQVLCEICNLGKSNKYSTDWR